MNFPRYVGNQEQVLGLKVTLECGDFVLYSNVSWKTVPYEIGRPSIGRPAHFDISVIQFAFSSVFDVHRTQQRNKYTQ